MSVSIRHVLSQGPVLRALSGVALAAVRQKGNGGAARANAEVPGPWIEETIPPRPAELVRDYVRHVGGDASSYKSIVPAHLFPQWGFPLAARALAGLQYPLVRVVNAGCRIEQRAPLPAGEPLHVKARIESIDDDGKRALITQRVITGTANVPEAIVADLRAFVPLAREKSNGKTNGAASKPRVPNDAREIAFLRIADDAGLDFAKLTGDFNPIHWVPAYARAAGFRACILHGFSTLARAISAIERAVLAGDPKKLATIDVRFSRPLVLPARVGVYVDDSNHVWVGDAPGGGAYLEGTFTHG